MSSTPESFEVTPLTKVRRLPKLAVYEKEQIHQILDEGFVCHVGFSDAGQVFVIPTGYARKGDWIYLHGKSSSHMMKALSKGQPICITVTLVDGLVLTRSIFNMSVNYRSVVIFGTPQLITEEQEIIEAMTLFTEHIIPGRWEDARQPTPSEIKATKMVKLHLEQVSAKVRDGPPDDDAADMSFPNWAGVLPLNTTVGEPIPDPTMSSGIPVPAYVKAYDRKTIHNSKPDNTHA